MGEYAVRYPDTKPQAAFISRVDDRWGRDQCPTPDLSAAATVEYLRIRGPRSPVLRFSGQTGRDLLGEAVASEDNFTSATRRKAFVRVKAKAKKREDFRNRVETLTRYLERGQAWYQSQSTRVDELERTVGQSVQKIGKVVDVKAMIRNWG